MNRIAALAFYCHIILNYNTVLYAFKRHHETGTSCNSESETSPYRWFDQLLDHFTSTDLTLWKQKYAVNTTFYKEGGPVFLRVGEESYIDIESEFSWQWMVFGQQFNALCFMLECRFYGESHPTEDTRVENLKYLTTDQILADIAYFINGMNQKYKLPENQKWVLFGTSISASYATWARVKYPYLVYGAVASSAPLLSIVDFRERYAAVFTYIAEKLNTECINNKYTKEIDSLSKTDWNHTNYDMRQWTYQTCAEFGWFQTSNKETDLFGPHFDVNFFIQECVDIFGTRFNETVIMNAAERINILYGAKTINPTNMIFVQHDRDPWYTVGMLPPDDNKNYHVFLLKGTSHCADALPSSPNDDPQLVDVRKKIVSILASWLNAES